MSEGQKGVSLLGMIAIVFSSMVGGGIFNIAQNMASSAGLGAVIFSWIITGSGMIFLVLTFKLLSDYRPDLNDGMYMYAQRGFGNYAGFLIAWGYWLCVVVGNVAFAMMLNDSFGALFPVLLEHGWESVLFGFCVVWSMYFIVIHGVMTASLINTVMTILKIGAIVIIITVLVVFFKLETFSIDFWGRGVSGLTEPMGGLGSQIMGTMLVTMFCFVGVEGGVMLSSYARKHRDVGKASVIGFYLALMIYAVISILCYGVRTQDELSKMPDPSIAYVLRSVCGEWAFYFVIITVILSILSAFISWTMLCAQAPYGAAKSHMLPRQFTETNRYGVANHGLLASTIFMCLFILIVCTTPDVYMAGLNLTTIMVLPAYALSGAFLWKISVTREGLPAEISMTKLREIRIIGILCLVYCLWCIFAGGALIFLASSILYLLGFYFYYITNRQSSIREKRKIKLFTNQELVIFMVLIICSIASVILLSLGKIKLS